MNKQPLVSIIVPAYNAAKLIPKTIDSILEQTYVPLEVIVVDSDSMDNTHEVLKPFIDAGKISYVRKKNEGGPASARKKGFEISRGEYVSFIDADDLISPEKIERQVRYMEGHPDCGVCYSDIAHFWHDRKDALLRKKLTYHEGFIFDELLRSNFIQVMTALVRRDVLEKWGMPGPEFRRSDDWYLWLNLAHHQVKFCFMPEILSFQRRQKEGTLSDQKTYFKETAETNIGVYERFEKMLSAEERQAHNVERLINFWRFRLAVGYAVLEDAAGARNALRNFKVASPVDAIKKAALRVLLFCVPAPILSRLILGLREIQKRRSFEPLVKEGISLPKDLRETESV